MSETIERRLSFNGGELSPWVESRVDLDKYRLGCRTMRNIVPKMYGTAMKRWGTVYLGDAADHSRKTRLVSFEFSAADSLMLEFGHETLRFWTTGDSAALVMDGASPLEVATPYGETEVHDLQFSQLNDLIYIAHASHAPRVLSRLADDSWTLEELVPEWPAVREENITDTTVTPSAVTGSSITLTASASLFDADMVGGYWLLTHRRESPFVKLIIKDESAGTATDALYVLGEWSLALEANTAGTNWTAVVLVERSYDKSTWETLRSVYTDFQNVQAAISGSEIEPAWLRIKLLSKTGTDQTPGVTLEAVDPNHYGIVHLTGYSSATSATASVVWELGDTTATKRWSEAAWSDHRGWPRALTIHQQRLIFGGNVAQPQTLWASVVDDFANFRVGAEADLGMRLTLASDEGNVIQWMVSQRDLSIGTGGAEWTLKSGDTTRAITPENVVAERATSYGSAYIQARAVNDATLFVQRSGRRIRELSYAFERDGYVAPDMTLLAEHLMSAAITGLAVQKSPETIVWVTTGAGDLLGMTYERQQQVLCWHRHDSGDAIESVAVVASDSEEDEVWFVVRRTVDGSSVRYVERWPLDQLETLKAGTTEDLVFLDSAVVWSGSSTTTISGLDHLEGETVDVLSNGSHLTGKTVTSGSITLDEATTKAIVGLPVTAELEPTHLAGNDPATVSRVGKWRLTRAVVDLWNSLGVEFSFDDGASWETIQTTDMEALMDTTPPLFTGLKQVSLAGASTDRLRSMKLRSAKPFPMNIRSLYVRSDLKMEA